MCVVCGWVVFTSDLLLQRHDDLDGHVEDAELGLRLVALQVRHAHAPELLQGFVDVSYPYPAGGWLA